MIAGRAVSPVAPVVPARGHHPGAAVAGPAVPEVDGGDRRRSPARRSVPPAAVVGVVAAGWLLLAAVVLAPGDPAVGLLHVALPLTAVLSAGAVLLRAAVVRAAHLAWMLLGLGLSAYGLGFVVLLHVSMGDGAVFGLNTSDAISLLLYPLSYAGLVGVSGAAGARLRLSSVLDAGVVLLAAGAVALAAVGLAAPALLRGSALAVLYALAYPVGGFTLLVVCLSGLVASRVRWTSMWLWVVGALTCMTVGDAVYGLQSADGTFRFGTWVDLLYTAGPAGLAVAAWQRPAAGSGAGARGLGWRGSRLRGPPVVLPTASGLTALVLLTGGCVRPLPEPAVVLAAAAGVLAVLRTATASRQERLLDQTLREVAVDPLTGLASRRALLSRLDKAAGTAATLLVTHSEGLDEIRESLGADIADRVLMVHAGRVIALSSEGLAGRLRDGSIAVLVPADGQDARAHALRVRQALERPVHVDGHRILLLASVGLALAPLAPVGAPAPTSGARLELAASTAEWLRCCDVALRAARKHPDRTALHADAMDTDARRRLQRLSELRAVLADATGPSALEDRPDEVVAAVDVGELVVHYQGKHGSRDRRLHSAEALIRWQHPAYGLLTPDAFLPLAEQAGLLAQVTGHVLRTVLCDAARLRGDRADWQVSVNVCADDLLDATFPDRVAGLLSTHGLPPDVLRLEVTETVVMSDPERVLDSLRALSRLGVGLSLDDYGTGLASLAYLRDLPVDELKIDRAFVTHLLASPDDELIIMSTVALAHGLGMTVVAEGAEDLPTVQRLQELRIDDVQGFALSRPVPLAALLTAPEHQPG